MAETLVTIKYKSPYGTEPPSCKISATTPLTAEHLPVLVADNYKFLGWVHINKDGHESSLSERTVISTAWLVPIDGTKGEYSVQFTALWQNDRKEDEPGTDNEKRQEKTVTPRTVEQVVVPDVGYTCLSSVTVEAIPYVESDNSAGGKTVMIADGDSVDSGGSGGSTDSGTTEHPVVEQATPTISVSDSGLITASATQEAGVVTAGTKSATLQLSTQEGKTITPSTSTQTAVTSGKYTTGVVEVAPIPSTYIQPTGTKTITTNGTHDVKSYASVSVSVPTSGEEVTPTIEVSSTGLITATAGNQSATKQLTTQASKTVTPTTSNQTAVAKGRYTTGAVTVKGDANLKAENIVSGVTIFNVTGTAQTGGGSVGYWNARSAPSVTCKSVAYFELPIGYAANQSFIDTYRTFYVFVDITNKRISVSTSSAIPYSQPSDDFSSGTYVVTQMNGYMKITYSGSTLSFVITDSSKCEIDDPVRGFYA